MGEEEDMEEVDTLREEAVDMVEEVVVVMEEEEEGAVMEEWAITVGRRFSLHWALDDCEVQRWVYMSPLCTSNSQ